MFIHYRTKGIVLKKRDRGESDQFFIVFTEDFGKIKILARAVRKITSKLRPAAEPGYYVEIEFIEGRSHKTLTDAVLLQKYSNARNSIAKLRIVFLITDIVDDFTGLQEKDRACFRNLKRSLEELDEFSVKSDGGLAIFYFYFLWNFIKHEGYLPELYCCTLCGDKAKKEKLFFSPSQGGIVCRICFPRMGRGSTISIEIDTLKALRFFLEKDWDSAKRLKMDNASLRNMRRVSTYYLEFIRLGTSQKFTT